jgi:hypothetical protein
MLAVSALHRWRQFIYRGDPWTGRTSLARDPRGWLHVVSEEVAAMTCRQWLEFPVDACQDHFNEMKTILDEEEPDYRD